MAGTLGCPGTRAMQTEVAIFGGLGRPCFCSEKNGGRRLFRIE